MPTVGWRRFGARITLAGLDTVKTVRVRRRVLVSTPTWSLVASVKQHRDVS